MTRVIRLSATHLNNLPHRSAPRTGRTTTSVSNRAILNPWRGARMDTRPLSRKSFGVSARRARPENLGAVSRQRCDFSLAWPPTHGSQGVLYSRLQSTLKTGDEFRNSCFEPAHFGPREMRQPQMAAPARRSSSWSFRHRFVESRLVLLYTVRVGYAGGPGRLGSAVGSAATGDRTPLPAWTTTPRGRGGMAPPRPLAGTERRQRDAEQRCPQC